jgi:hypothetical protein
MKYAPLVVALCPDLPFVLYIFNSKIVFNFVNTIKYLKQSVYEDILTRHETGNS